MDLERGRITSNGQQQPSPGASRHTSNISWNGIRVTVIDRATKSPLNILEDVSGYVEAGEMLALMGPSGSGKTTALNVLANRKATASCKVTGGLLVNGKHVSNASLRNISAYVEQEDALIGSLTVLEAINFASRLSTSGRGSSGPAEKERSTRCLELVHAFGLDGQAHSKIGTPLMKGISGGQKRRLSVACHLVTSPRILFLDEPTSGLDSAAAFEVMSRMRTIAKQENMIVIASIHQPSVSTFNLFSKVLLLSRGKTVYFGPTNGLEAYLSFIDRTVPSDTSIAEHILTITNVDFAESAQEGKAQIDALHETWIDSAHNEHLKAHISGLQHKSEQEEDNLQPLIETQPFYKQTLILLHQLFLKSYRDILAYQIRIAMYLGLAIMMGTVWLRLGNDQHYISSYITAIFFSGAFMSFMAVAYVPAFLEDYAAYRKDKANGLYGPSAFLLANFIIGIPFLYFISILFSIVAYWMVNFNDSARGFFLFSTWLFVDLLAAESLVVLISVIVPIFVAALAITAFSNGLWMSVGGFLVPQNVLNKFWYYTFYWIDYQRYVFQGMMFNEFESRTFNCGVGCQCMYPSALEQQCKIEGGAVLRSLGYSRDQTGMWFGILISIVAGMRLITWLILLIKTR